MAHKFEDSIYQKEIYKTVKDTDKNIIISAVAGSGKTTTIIRCFDILPKDSKSIYLAFNNSVVEELKDKVSNDNIEISTIHSICWRSLMRHYNFKVKINSGKVMKFSKKEIEKNNIEKKKVSYYQFLISKMVDLARQNLVTEKEDLIKLAEHHSFLIEEKEVKMIFDVLEKMNKDRKEFDFTDMIYRAYLDSVKFPKFDFVFIDESQDLSKLQQTVVMQLVKRKGRIVAVGDPNQAIYGFAGADSESYENLKNIMPNVAELPLSVCYRCSKNVVREARKINKEILEFKDKEEGSVMRGLISDIEEGDWVVCRNVKPLVALNMYLLSLDVKSYVKGFDIGLNLISIVNKTGSKDTKTILKRYETEILKQRLKLIKKGVKNPDRTEKIDTMRQKFDILTMLSFGLTSKKDLIDKIKEIFKNDGEGVMLSTIHKVKGLENNRVFFLLPDLIPNKFATEPWEFKQESNLAYVAITRAKTDLVYIQKDEFEGVKEFMKMFKTDNTDDRIMDRW